MQTVHFYDLIHFIYPKALFEYSEEKINKDIIGIFNLPNEYATVLEKQLTDERGDGDGDDRLNQILTDSNECDKFLSDDELIYTSTPIPMPVQE